MPRHPRVNPRMARCRRQLCSVEHVQVMDDKALVAIDLGGAKLALHASA